MGNKRKNIVIVLGILIIAVISIWGNYGLVNSVAQEFVSDDQPSKNIIFVSPLNSTRFEEGLNLDPTFNITKVHSGLECSNLLQNPQDRAYFDIIVLLDTKIESSFNSVLLAFVEEGGGLFIILGSHSCDNIEFLSNVNITESSNYINNTETRVADSSAAELGIQWNSVPEIEAYCVVDVHSSATTLVSLASEDNTVDDRQPLLIQQNYGNGSILASVGWFGDELNLQFIEGLYFCYFTYSGTLKTINQAPIAYGDWDYAPVPHTSEKIFLGVVIFIIAGSALSFYLLALKKSKKVIQSDYLAKFSQKTNSKLADTDEKEWDPTSNDWEDIGSHRQISGFLLGFFAGILVLIPQVILTGFVFPRYIMPYPAVAGMYGFAQDIFKAMWTLLDMSTSVALAKYFAQYRVEKPEKAIRYIQIFIWWQFLSGIFQLTLVTSLGLFYFPQTSLAHMSYLFVFHSFIQFPGWFQVLIFVYQGMQRIDLQLVTNVLQMIVFDLIAKYIFILLFRGIFSQFPAYGEFFGAMLGYAVGEWFGQFLTFIFSSIIFKKLGYHISTLFRIDFTWVEFKEVMIFGGKIVIGALLVPLVYLLQASLAAVWIRNYNAELGYYSMVFQITQVIALVNLFTQGLMSGMSESYGNGKKKLFDLYLFQGFKWSNFVAFFLISSLAVVLWRFVIGAMGPTWERAVVFVPILLIRASFEPFTWLGDQTFKACEKTGRLAISWVIEQGSRVILLILFLHPELGDLQMMGILYAWFASLLLKEIYQYYAIIRYVTKPKMYWWQSFIAPGLAAIINYIIFELFARLLFNNDIITAVVLFLLIFLVFFNFYSFLVGWLGGWDDNTLREFERAAYMVKGIGFFAQWLYKATAFGSKHSLLGLHNKHPVKIYDEAGKEARELTILKKQLQM